MGTWYAAHIITYIACKNARQQNDYPVYENICLIEAESHDAAYEKARIIGKSYEGDSDGTLTLGNEPAEFIFGGIRKLIQCQNSAEQLISTPNNDNKPTNGSEISYSRFLVSNKKDLKKLIQGQEVVLRYTE